MGTAEAACSRAATEIHPTVDAPQCGYEACVCGVCVLFPFDVMHFLSSTIGFSNCTLSAPCRTRQEDKRLGMGVGVLRCHTEGERPRCRTQTKASQDYYCRSTFCRDTHPNDNAPTGNRLMLLNPDHEAVEHEPSHNAREALRLRTGPATNQAAPHQSNIKCRSDTKYEEQ